MKITKLKLKQAIEEELEVLLTEEPADLGRRRFLKGAAALGSAAAIGIPSLLPAAEDTPEYRKSFEVTAGVYNRIRHEMRQLEEELIELDAHELSQRVADIRHGSWAAIGKEITKVLESIY